MKRAFLGLAASLLTATAASAAEKPISIVLVHGAFVDASGDPSEMASRTSLARFVQGGVKPTSTNALLSELHRTWARPEAAELAKLYGLAAPNYAAVMESFRKAQEAARG